MCSIVLSVKNRIFLKNTVNDALKRIGYRGKQTAHGFRATAATILDEVLDFHPNWINVQLAHVVNDQNKTSYALSFLLK